MSWEEDEKRLEARILAEAEIEMAQHHNDLARRLTSMLDQATVGGWHFVEGGESYHDLREALDAMDRFPPRAWWRQ